LSIAYITAFIFYYFVNHTQEEQDREVLAQIALSTLYSMRLGHLGLIADILGQELERDYDPSFEELRDILKRTDLDDERVFRMEDPPTRISLRELFDIHLKGNHQLVKQILSHGTRIDAEVLSYLFIVRDSSANGLNGFTGRLSHDDSVTTLYRITETVYFTHLLWKRMKRHDRRDYKRDTYFEEVRERNLESMVEAMVELGALRGDGKIERKSKATP
jgi:hypothetical protein